MMAKSTAADMLRAAARPDRSPASAVNRIAVEPHQDQPKRKAKRTLRYTIDLEPNERRALRVFALDNGVDASAVIKAVIRLLEHDVMVSDRVLDEIGR